MFEQKFVQIGQGLSSNVSKTKPGTTLEQPTKSDLLDPAVTGILLMMLEDDSMAVRLAGIKTMSSYGRAYPDIRSRCLTFLIDMLNDEINDVRIGALHGI